MDPQSQNQGSFEMPVAGSAANMIPPIPVGEVYPATPEVSPRSSAAAPVLSSGLSSSGLSAVPVFQQSAVPEPPAASVTSPAVADDLDLIEKEWVDRAKAIVAQTRSDPYSQNKHMNQFKADYMQKRYGKEIKLDES